MPRAPRSRQLQGEGAEGLTLTYTASGLPDSLTLEETTGLITGTIADLASNGSPYPVTVTVSDGTLSKSQSFSWEVTYLTVKDPGDQESLAGSKASLLVEGSAPSGANLTWEAGGLP